MNNKIIYMIASLLMFGLTASEALTAALYQKLTPISAAETFPDKKLLENLDSFKIKLWPIIELDCTAFVNASSIKLRVQSINTEIGLPNSVQIIIGRAIDNPQNSILLKSEIAKQLNLKPGDTMRLTFHGSKTETLTISGLFNDPYGCFSAIVSNRSVFPKIKPDRCYYAFFQSNRAERDHLISVYQNAGISSLYRLESPASGSHIMNILNCEKVVAAYDPGEEFDVPLLLNSLWYSIGTRAGWKIQITIRDEGYSAAALAQVKDQIRETKNMGNVIEAGDRLYVLYRLDHNDGDQKQVLYGIRGIIGRYLLGAQVILPYARANVSVQTELYGLFQMLISKIKIRDSRIKDLSK